MSIPLSMAFAGFDDLMKQNGMTARGSNVGLDERVTVLTNTIGEATYCLEIRQVAPAQMEFRFSRPEVISDFVMKLPRIERTLRLIGSGPVGFIQMVAEALVFKSTEVAYEFRTRMDVYELDQDLMVAGAESASIKKGELWVGRREDKVWFAMIMPGIPNIRFELDMPKD